MKNRKYNIGDAVYHVTPESDKGIVINANYNLLCGFMDLSSFIFSKYGKLRLLRT